jgi:DNA-binding NarL/FixJ family response regulator
MEKIRIAIADDQNLFLEGLVNLLSTNPTFELVAQAENGRILLEKLKIMDELPHIALIDMNMPEMNGVELNNILHRDYPEIKVIVLSVHGEERYISKMIQAGACGYLVKNCETTELFQTIINTHQHGFYFNNDAVNAMRNAVNHRKKGMQTMNNMPVSLSERELVILKMICMELTNAEIAEKLFISNRTVDGHRTNLLGKIGCKNTAGLVIFAIKYGVFDVQF